MKRFTVRLSNQVVLDLTDHLPRIDGVVVFSDQARKDAICKHFPQHYQVYIQALAEKSRRMEFVFSKIQLQAS